MAVLFIELNPIDILYTECKRCKCMKVCYSALSRSWRSPLEVKGYFKHERVKESKPAVADNPVRLLKWGISSQIMSVQNVYMVLQRAILVAMICDWMKPKRYRRHTQNQRYWTVTCMPHIIRVRFKVSTAATMKNAVFLDIKTQFEPHRKDMSPLHRPAG
jgi:hypothetical protein